VAELLGHAAQLAEFTEVEKVFARQMEQVAPPLASA
jgi:hypothetical protein